MKQNEISIAQEDSEAQEKIRQLDDELSNKLKSLDSQINEIRETISDKKFSSVSLIMWLVCSPIVGAIFGAIFGLIHIGYI